MMQLKTALKIKLKDFKKIDNWKDSSETIARKHSYNRAQKDLLQFIEDFESGGIGQEYLTTLRAQQEDK